MKILKFKILKNKWVRVLLAVLAALLLLYAAVVAKLTWDGYQKQAARQAAIDAFQESIEKPFREDTYGGKTPEETWAMFLSALKQGNLELASKYYDVEHQTEARKWLEGLRKNRELDGTIKEMETIHKSTEKSISTNKSYYYYYYYDTEFKQTLSSPVVFYLNPYTKVWKIVW